MAKAIEKRLSGARRDRRRGPRHRAAGADRTVTQIGFPAPCRRRGTRAWLRLRALPPGLAEEDSPGPRVSSGVVPLNDGDREEGVEAPWALRDRDNCWARVVTGLDLVQQACAVKEPDPFRSYRKS